MIPVLSREAMRRFDARAIEAGVPGIILMENAGRGAAEMVRENLKAPSAVVVVVCGTGNNGGDGFVLARQLRAFGVEPRAVLVGDVERIAGDARIAYDAYLAIGGTVEVAPTDLDATDLRAVLLDADVVVDALFGTGLDRPLAGLLAEAAEGITQSKGFRVALDVPSGIQADTGVALGPSVTADLTVTFAFTKLGLMTPRGRAHAGLVRTVSIGVPCELPRDIAAAAELVERSDVASWLSPRGADAHKYTAGHVAVLGGSHGKFGAPLLAAEAALLAGAGAVTLLSWPEVVQKLEGRVREVMVATAFGDATTDVNAISAALDGKKAVVLGPGLGLDDRARALADAVLSSYLGPLVLDADGLTLFAGRVDAIAAGVQRARVLTPHAAEAARLLGGTAQSVEADRVGAARSLAHRSQSIVVLKGAHSVIADPDGRILLGPIGSPALATAGSGDVLSGAVGAMLAIMPPLEAAAAAVYLHAEAGHRLASVVGDRGVLASAVARELPLILGELLRERRRG
ncbi:MAG: NAD(P)H-hydrate dehydratase [Myxococcales bacterium]|nr:NAD(P)H-hydrate dehydratase [Myxococcales bacterium]